MASNNSILKNSTFLVVGNVFQRIISFGTIVLITRYLEPVDYGKYSLVISLVSIIAVFWSFGLNTVLTRDIAEDRTRAAMYMGQAIIIKLIFFCILLVGIMFYTKWMNYGPEIIISILIFSFGKLIGTINEVFRTVFSAFRRMGFNALFNVTRSLFVLIGVTIVYHHNDHRLILIFFSYMFGFIVVNILSLIVLWKKFVLPKFSTKSKEIKRLIVSAKPFVLIASIDIILFRLDHIMLSKISGDVEVGLYAASYTVFEIIISLFPLIIMGAAFPVLSETFNNDIDEFKKISNILAKLLIFLGIPISCGITILANDICLATYGIDYFLSGQILSILGVSIWAVFLSGFFGWALTAMCLQKKVLQASASSLIINIIGNLFLIPLFGAKGAAMVSVFCVLYQLLFMAICFRRAVFIKNSLRLGTIFIGAAIMSLSVYLLTVSFEWDNLIIKLLLCVLVGAIVFFSITLPFKVLERQEILLIRKT